jgi:uncharacterized protein
MINNKQDLIEYRISRAKETFEEALLLGGNNHWNAVASRLYYTCFYIVNALLIKNDLSFSTHNGIKSEFHRFFVKTGIVSMDSGRTYSRLFNLRQEGDYADFQRFDAKDIEPPNSASVHLCFSYKRRGQK